MKKIILLLMICTFFVITASAKNARNGKKGVKTFPVSFTLPCGITVYGDYQCPGCTLQQMLYDIGQAGLQLQQQICGTPAPVAQ